MALKKPSSRSPKKIARKSAATVRKPAAKAPRPAAKALPKATAKAVRKGAVKATSRAAARPKAKAAAAGRTARKPAARPARPARKAVLKARMSAARGGAATAAAGKRGAKPAAKTSAPRAPRKATPPKPSPERELARRIVEAAREVKAEAILLYDLQKQSAITDYVLLCSGRSQGHVRGVADKIQERLKADRIRPLSSEGYSEGSWIVMDYSDVIVHIFHPETRLYYDLESLLKHFPHEACDAAGDTAPSRRRSAAP